MANFDAFVKTIKQIVKDTIHAEKPVNICFGVVTAEAPLKILVDQKLELSEAQLILTRNVTDFTTDETVDHFTEKAAGGSGYALYEAHTHAYKGRKEFLIHHKLLTGDKVLLLREQGGQRYIILDRVVM